MRYISEIYKKTQCIRVKEAMMSEMTARTCKKIFQKETQDLYC
jgi:hypothetical protein